MPDGINYDAFSEALNDKADRDLQNVDTVSGGDAVIAFQRPTAENGYTWFRKYASGWVEQGGIGNLVNSSYTANLPVEMADTNYFYSFNTAVVQVNTAVAGRKCTTKTTTSITIVGTYASGGATNYDQGGVVWEVKGMAAQ